MAKADEVQLPWPVCSLLLFVATSAEENALQEQAAKLELPCQKYPALTNHFRERGLRDDAWSLGTIGGETVIAIGCSRIKGNPVMGPYGRLGSAAKGMRYLAATGAQGIIQLGMAFGISRGPQSLGDVLVSTSLIPYDKRDVKPASNEPGYFSDYSAVEIEPARPALVQRCLREKARTQFGFAVHVGAMLSGAARIHCAAFRDELYGTVPHGNEPIVGGEMEGVGLLAAAVKADDPAWCVVKGICDFADEQRGEEIKVGLTIAPQNAAHFVLSSLLNDAKMLA
ncbi:MAG TPA: nucleoside phosphorylase-like protein [Pirellulales bacterium]|jgi:adenosylhomocysteine nucleosidase|nr:nucleoside phosphorylase-like protein [Pirellulales bacterium]